MYSMYHHSHPTLPERLRAMEKFAQTKEAKAGLGLKENKEL
jgi:Zn-dependent protease with chaperone function